MNTDTTPITLARIVADAKMTHQQIAERMASATPPVTVSRERVTQIVNGGCGKNKTLRAFAFAVEQPLSVIMDAEAETTKSSGL